jgi:hypothetical protein
MDYDGRKVGGQNWFDGQVVQTILRFVLWGYVFCAVMSFFAVPVDRFDDSIALVDALLVQQGRTPNLDFFSYYPPLGHYLNAAAFNLLGYTVLAVRVIGAALYFALLLSAGKLFRSRCPQFVSLLPVAMLFLASSIGNAISLPSWPGFAVSVLALVTYLYAQGGTRGRLWIVAVSGALTAAALLYRINFGGYVAIAVVVDQLLPWRDRSGALPWGRQSLRNYLSIAAVFWGLLALCSVGFCLWVYGRHIVTPVLNLVVFGQALIVARFNDLPFSLAITCAVALPPLWIFVRSVTGVDVIPLKAFSPVAIGVCLLVMVRLGHAHASIVPIVVAVEAVAVILLHLFVYRLERFELIGLLFFCGLLHYYLSRVDYPHWRLLPIGAALLLLLLIFSATGAVKSERGSISKGSAFAMLMIAIFVCLTSVELRPVAAYIPNGVRLSASLGRHSRMSDADRVLGGDVPEALWLSIYPDEDELRAMRYLRARTGVGDAIFVGAPVNSKIDTNYSNDLRAYWLAGRKVGVRTFELEPGMITKPVIQRDLINDLQRNNVSWLVIDSAYSSRDIQAYNGSQLLDQYITANYREEAQFGSYSIWSHIEVNQR